MIHRRTVPKFDSLWHRGLLGNVKVCARNGLAVYLAGACQRNCLANRQSAEEGQKLELLQVTAGVQVLADPLQGDTACCSYR